MSEKNPPGPLECSLALRRPGDEEEEAKAKEGEAIVSLVADDGGDHGRDDEGEALSAAELLPDVL